MSRAGCGTCSAARVRSGCDRKRTGGTRGQSGDLNNPYRLCHRRRSGQAPRPRGQLGGAILKIWSGRRGSNPRPRPWQGRALPLSYTRIREIGGDRSPATGRAMPNAARECNSRRGPQSAPVNRHNRRSHGQIRPKAGGWGSADCKLGFQGPIKAGKVLEHSKDIRRGFQ